MKFSYHHPRKSFTDQFDFYQYFISLKECCHVVIVLLLPTLVSKPDCVWVGFKDSYYRSSWWDESTPSRRYLMNACAFSYTLLDTPRYVVKYFCSSETTEKCIFKIDMILIK